MSYLLHELAYKYFIDVPVISELQITSLVQHKLLAPLPFSSHLQKSYVTDSKDYRRGKNKCFMKGKDTSSSCQLNQPSINNLLIPA